MTVLIFGSKCSIKLRPQAGLGKVDNFSYYVSIDGGEAYRYDLPSFDSGEEGDGKEMTLFVPVKFDIENDGQNKLVVEKSGEVVKRQAGKAVDGKKSTLQVQEERKLTPHTIHITSDPHSPFRFEGVLTENALITQGWGWANKQDERVTVEFIGEGIDAERLGGMGLTGGWVEAPVEETTPGVTGKLTPSGKTKLIEAPSLVATTQYKAAERLGLRHWHTSAGVCLTANCNSANPLPGLQTQYFQLNPLNNTLPFSLTTDLTNTDPKNPKNKLDGYFFIPKQPTFPVASPSHLVVDLGVADVLIHGVDPAVYQKELTLFLSKLRMHAYPAANILVVARQDAPGKSTARTHANDNGDAAVTHSDSPEAHDTPHAWFHSIIPSTPDTAALRKKLFKATAAAAATASALYPPIPKIGSTGTITFVPVIDTGANPINDLVRALCVELGPAAQEGSRTARVCGEMLSGVQKRGWAWDLLFLVLGVGMAFVAKETFWGAVMAVVDGVKKYFGMGSPGMRKGKGRAGEDVIREEDEGELMGVDKGKRRADEEKGKLG